MPRMLRYPVIESTATERRSYRRWWIEDSGLSRRELRLLASSIWPEGPVDAPRPGSLVRVKIRA